MELLAKLPISSYILFDISLIFFGALFLATIFLYLKQPIIIAYIVLGMLVGPLGFRLINDIHLIEEISDLGILFLMFLLGVNLHPQKLMQLLKITLPIVVITSLLCMGVFFGIAMLLGWGVGTSIFIALSLIFSSTIIGIKLLPTSTLHQQREGELIISVLLLQDIIAIFILIFLYGVDAQSQLFSSIFLLVKLIIFIALSFLVVKYILIPIIKKFSVIQDYLFLVSLGWCFSMAQIAEWVGFSYEIGAFIAGFSLATSNISLVISEGLKPLREFFLIIFFFSIGARIDILEMKNVLLPVLVFGTVVVAIKYPLFRIAYTVVREEEKIIKSIGWRLAQASEFSILVAYGAEQMGRITSEAALFIHLVTLVSMILSTYCVVKFCNSPIALNKKQRRD